jgi:hypothetical protein
MSSRPFDTLRDKPRPSETGKDSSDGGAVLAFEFSF